MKKLVYHKKSWHFHICQIAYGIYFKPKSNACPYLWKQLIWAILLFIPLGMISLPFIMLSYIFSKTTKYDSTWIEIEEVGVVSFVPIVSFMIYIGILILISMIGMFFISPKSNMFASGIIGWVIALVCLIAYIRDQYKERQLRKYSNYMDEEHKPNPIIEGIKSWYNRNCPEVEWKD